MDNDRGQGGARAVISGASQAASDTVIRPLSMSPKGLPSFQGFSTTCEIGQLSTRC